MTVLMVTIPAPLSFPLLLQWAGAMDEAAVWHDGYGGKYPAEKIAAADLYRLG